MKCFSISGKLTRAKQSYQHFSIFFFFFNPKQTFLLEGKQTKNRKAKGLPSLMDDALKCPGLYF